MLLKPEPSGSNKRWFEDELQKLEQREALLREHGVPWDKPERLRAHAALLHELLRRCPPSRRQLTSALVDVARLSALALCVNRTSVWLFDPTAGVLRCALELRGLTQLPSTLTIAAADCPGYIYALETQTAIAANDACDDGRTSELRPYLEQHAVGALLHIPLRVPGELLGVVCLEHVGSTRTWEPEEIDFAANVGTLVVLTLETERRLTAEYAARGIEAKYQNLVESLPVTIYSFDYRTYTLDYVSPQGLELGEFESIPALLNKGVQAWIERIHPDDRKAIVERLASGGVSAGLPEEVTYRLLLPSGKIRWVRDTGRVVCAPDGRPVSVQGILTDITEQVSAEALRKEYERRYQILLESVGMGAVTLDTAGRATFVNDAFARISGYPRSELVGVDWFERVVPASVRERVRSRFLRDVARGAVLPKFELEIQTKDGRRRHLLCANTLLRDPEGTVQGTASLALDVTETRALNDVLFQQVKLESLGRLAAGVAHDFNNLLTVLSHQTYALQRGLGRDDPNSYAAMEQALEQATALVRALLTYGRRESRRPQAVCVDELISDTQSLLKAMTKARVELSLSLHAQQASVRVDPSELRQVLINLVTNAADAANGPGGHVSIASDVNILSDQEAWEKGIIAGGEVVVVCVKDNGPGIDPSVLGHIFEPFFTTKGDGRGTGLGLAIAQSVVSAAGGVIQVESARGQGSTFRVLLPTRGREQAP